MRTGGQRCTSMGLQGQWCADRGTVVHQHGPPGTVHGVWTGTVVHQHGPPGTVVQGCSYRGVIAPPPGFSSVGDDFREKFWFLAGSVCHNNY